MKKLTLQFPSLSELAGFSKLLNEKYFLNTINLTLTTELKEPQIQQAIERYKARLIETTEKVFSYEQAS